MTMLRNVVLSQQLGDQQGLEQTSLKLSQHLSEKSSREKSKVVRGCWKQKTVCHSQQGLRRRVLDLKTQTTTIMGAKRKRKGAVEKTLICIV
jgi:hypothetical protein